MKVTRKLAGTGFTAREITTFSDLTIDEGAKLVIDEFPRRTADSRHPFHAYLDALEAKAREVLRRHNLPDELVGYREDGDGRWVKTDADEKPRRGSRYSSLEVIIREAGYAHDTAPGFAERMLRLIADLKGLAVDPAVLSVAFQLGGLTRECALAFLVKGRGRPGGKNRGKGSEDRNVWMAQAFNKRRPTSDLSDTALASDIAARWARVNRAKPLSRSAAYDAVQSGMKIMKILSGLRRRPDGS